MKLIIAGSRSITDYNVVKDYVLKHFDVYSIKEIVSGGARGVDWSGEELAKELGIPVKKFIPDWDKEGKSAGFKRNEKMVDYADALVAFWDSTSKGTKHIIDYGKKHLKSVTVVNVSPSNKVTTSKPTKNSYEEWLAKYFEPPFSEKVYKSKDGRGWLLEREAKKMYQRSLRNV